MTQRKDLAREQDAALSVSRPVVLDAFNDATNTSVQHSCIADVVRKVRVSVYQDIRCTLDGEESVKQISLGQANNW